LDQKISTRNVWLSDAAIIGYLSLAALLFHFLFYRGYGYFRDELYFMACGEHLDWGYVDQPPLVPLVARFSRWLMGDSRFSIRFFSMVAAAATVWITGFMTRELGGRRYAQVLACVAVMVAPVYVGSYLSTDDLLPPIWMGCLYVALLIFNGGSPKLWLLFGALAGLGLQDKHATLFFGFSFFVALLLTPQRNAFRGKWIWLGGLVALLIFLPNLIWEYRHNWATLELLNNIHRSNKNVVLGPLGYLRDQILLMNPISFPIWLAGLVWFLFSRGAKAYRAMGWTYVVMLVLFVALKGKDYYLVPIYPVLFAGGAIVLDRWMKGTRRAWLKPAIVVLLLVGGALLAPFATAILPVDTFIAYERALHLAPPPTETHDLGKLPQQYADMFGWPEMAAVVASVYDRVPPEERPKCAIFGQNYGEAGAIDFFGARYGLPKAISGHQNYFLWGPRDYTGECMIVIGDRREVLESIFDRVELAGVTHHDYAMPYENNLPIWLCRGFKRGSLRELWPGVKHWM
jgi:hypothetical protein